eukprot:Gb_30894 [translate_table: standard]
MWERHFPLCFMWIFFRAKTLVISLAKMLLEGNYDTCKLSFQGQDVKNHLSIRFLIFIYHSGNLTTEIVWKTSVLPTSARQLDPNQAWNDCALRKYNHLCERRKEDTFESENKKICERLGGHIRAHITCSRRSTYTDFKAKIILELLKMLLDGNKDAGKSFFQTQGMLDPNQAWNDCGLREYNHLCERDGDSHTLVFPKTRNGNGKDITLETLSLAQGEALILRSRMRSLLPSVISLQYNCGSAGLRVRKDTASESRKRKIMSLEPEDSKSLFKDLNLDNVVLLWDTEGQVAGAIIDKGTMLSTERVSFWASISVYDLLSEEYWKWVTEVGSSFWGSISAYDLLKRQRSSGKGHPRGLSTATLEEFRNQAISKHEVQEVNQEGDNYKDWYWDTRQSNPAHTQQLPERCYTFSVRHPLMVVGTADRNVIVFNLQNPQDITAQMGWKFGI